MNNTTTATVKAAEIGGKTQWFWSCTACANPSRWHATEKRAIKGANTHNRIAHNEEYWKATMHQRLKNGEAKCGGDRREPSSYFGQRVTCAACKEAVREMIWLLTAVSLRYGVRFVIEPKVA